MRFPAPIARLTLVLPVLAVCAIPVRLAWAGPPWPAPPRPPAPVALPVVAMVPSGEPGMLCRQAIRSAELAAGIPSQLMAAIGRVETGRPDAQGIIHPWPWSINAEGQGHYYDSKAEAIAAVQALQARGVRSIDVGCMQVNLMHHPDAFTSLDQAFDPVANANYAARFLTQLHAQTNSWDLATADYHSATPDIGADYQRKVAEVWPEERARLGLTPAAPGNVWSTNVWTSNVWNSGGGSLAAPSPVTRPGTILAGSGGFLPLNRGSSGARIIPAVPGQVGRDLQAYRATPVAITSRQPPRAPM